VPRSKSLTAIAGGSYQRPVLVLVTSCSGGSALAEEPVLTWRELRTLMHEMGHAVHNFVSRTHFQHLWGTRWGIGRESIGRRTHVQCPLVWKAHLVVESGPGMTSYCSRACRYGVTHALLESRDWGNVVLAYLPAQETVVCIHLSLLSCSLNHLHAQLAFKRHLALIWKLKVGHERIATQCSHTVQDS
jgi:hypothetical protein